MDIEKQKAIATSRTVDNLRLLMMSCIEGASETSQLLYEQLISGEVRKIGVQPRDFFQTIINILKRFRDTFPVTERDAKWGTTVSSQTPTSWDDNQPDTNSTNAQQEENLNTFAPAANSVNTSVKIGHWPKTEQTSPVEGSRGFQFMSAKKQEPRSPTETDRNEEEEMEDEFATYNPNVTIRRFKQKKKNNSHLLGKVRTPATKKRRGRPLKTRDPLSNLGNLRGGDLSVKRRPRRVKIEDSIQINGETRLIKMPDSTQNQNVPEPNLRRPTSFTAPRTGIKQEQPIDHF